MKTPIILITGYLGAGKTTLIRKILDTTDRKIAVLMNEFGKIGIDGTVVKGKSIDVIEISGGCVCCSLTGEFEAAIKEIISDVKPDMIVVETTGVAEPDAIVGDILENMPQARLDLVVAVADADSLVRYPSIGLTGRNQIEMGDVILLNKIDLVDDKQNAQIREKLMEINDHAMIFEAVRCAIDVEMLFDVRKTRKMKAVDEKHSEKLESFEFVAEKMNYNRLDVVLTTISDVVRIKGFVNTEKGGFLLNYVLGRHEFEPYDTENTKLVFIGKNMNKSRIEKELKSCEVQ